jgi:hypothetical protein
LKEALDSLKTTRLLMKVVAASEVSKARARFGRFQGSHNLGQFTQYARF